MIKKEEISKKSNILTNVSVIYNDDFKQIFDAIKVIDKGYILGKISMKNGEEVFTEYGFILKENIKKINWDNIRKIKREKSKK
jgi:hypothetical protein